jgi:hypothetical protein
MNVKTAYSGFRMHECLAALKQWGDTVWYRLRIVVGALQQYVFVGGHMDKAPLVLVSSCSTSLYGGTKE